MWVLVYDVMEGGGCETAARSHPPPYKMLCGFSEGHCGPKCLDNIKDYVKCTKQVLWDYIVPKKGI